MQIPKPQFSIYELRVRKSPTGKGLFAEKDIPKGKYLIEYIGKTISKEEEETINSKYLFTVGRNWTINGNTKENIARYINHSCRPNCEAKGPRGHVYIYSTRKIKPGEELTYDYGEEYFDEYIKPFGCKCKKCKKSKR